MDLSGMEYSYTAFQYFSGFYFLTRTLICTEVMFLLNVVFDMVLVLELCKIILLCFCPFLFFFLSFVWEQEIPGFLLKREASILFHLYPASLSQEFKPVSIYCLFYSELSRSQLQARSIKGRAFPPARSELKCFTRRVQKWNLLCCRFS